MVVFTRGCGLDFDPPFFLACSARSVARVEDVRACSSAGGFTTMQTYEIPQKDEVLAIAGWAAVVLGSRV